MLHYTSLFETLGTCGGGNVALKAEGEGYKCLSSQMIYSLLSAVGRTIENITVHSFHEWKINIELLKFLITASCPGR